MEASMKDLIERLRKQSVCIYIASEKGCADDVSDGLRKAADALEQQAKRIEELERRVVAMGKNHEDMKQRAERAERDCDNAIIDYNNEKEAREKAESALAQYKRDLAASVVKSQELEAENSKLRSALEIVHFKREPWQ